MIDMSCSRRYFWDGTQVACCETNLCGGHSYCHCFRFKPTSAELALGNNEQMIQTAEGSSQVKSAVQTPYDLGFCATVKRAPPVSMISNKSIYWYPEVHAHTFHLSLSLSLSLLFVRTCAMISPEVETYDLAPWPLMIFPIPFMAIAIAALGMRLWVRCVMTRSFGWDDGWLIASFVSSFVKS